jgi:hypothetical protein
MRFRIHSAVINVVFQALFAAGTIKNSLFEHADIGETYARNPGIIKFEAASGTNDMGKLRWRNNSCPIAVYPQENW